MNKKLFLFVSGVIIAFGIFYATWCWGLWGRDNLLMQYVFQCACPHISEQARYKPFKVIASACSKPYLVSYSPNDKYVIIVNGDADGKVIRLNLENGEINDLNFNEGSAWFLTDDLLVLATAYEERYFLYDLSDGTKVEVYRDPDVDKALVNAKNMDKLWLSEGMLVGIKNDYKEKPENSVLISTAIYTYTQEQEFLRSHGIEYEEVWNYKLPQNGLEADLEGIHLNNKLIVDVNQQIDGDSVVYVPRWVLGGNAVIYKLISARVDLFGFPTNIMQPILLLEVPSQYRNINTATP